MPTRVDPNARPNVNPVTQTEAIIPATPKVGSGAKPETTTQPAESAVGQPAHVAPRPMQIVRTAPMGRPKPTVSERWQPDARPATLLPSSLQSAERQAPSNMAAPVAGQRPSEPLGLGTLGMAAPVPPPPPASTPPQSGVSPEQAAINDAMAAFRSNLGGAPRRKKASAQSVESTTEAPGQAAEPAAPAPMASRTATVDAPVQPDMDSDSEVEAPEIPRAPRAAAELPDTQFREALNLTRESGELGLDRNPGSAVSAQMEGDPDLGLEEVSVPVSLIYRASLSPSSGWRVLLSTDETIDMEKLLNDYDYAKSTILEFFARPNSHQGMAAKYPVTTESDAHLRTIRSHEGDSIRISSIIFEIFNADFDGDAMQVSVDKDSMQGVKSAVDHLITMDRKGKLSAEYFGWVPWGSEADVKDRLKSMFLDKAGNPMVLLDVEINGLAEALIKAWAGDRGAGTESTIKWVRAIADRLGGGDRRRRDSITLEVLLRIYQTNRMLANLQKAADGTITWAYITPADMNAVVKRGEAPFASHATDGGIHANDYDALGQMNTPTGTVENRNPLFRIIAGLNKLVRERSELLTEDSPIGRTAKTVDSILSLMMSGIESLDDSVRNVRMEASRIFMEEMHKLYPWAKGKPIVDISSPEAFIKWLNDFTMLHNDAVFGFNAVAAHVKLDMTLMPYEDLMLPKIPDAGGDEKQQIARRKAQRLQFKNEYGEYSMKALFGNKAPRGYRNMTLNEFIETNRLRYTGLNTTEFSSVDDFILRLADLRTSFAHDYRDSLLKYDHQNKVWSGALYDMMEGRNTKFVVQAARLKELGVELSQDAQLFAEAIFLLDPQMFVYLGIKSAADFKKTEIGQKFANARSADELGGVYYEAITMYRFGKLRDLAQAAEASRLAGDSYAAYRSELKLEQGMKALASSSTLWAVLIDRYEAGHTDISDILYGDLTMSEKERALVKLVQDHPRHRRKMETYEVAAELMAAPKGPYSTQRFSSNLGHSARKKAVQASRDLMDRYAKTSYQHCVDNVDEAIKEHAGQGALMPFLKTVAASGTVLNSFQPWMMVDAILSNLERTYKSSEKNSQEAVVSYLYVAVSTLINGGVFSDLAVGADFGLDEIAADRFQRTPRILAKLLSDPDFSITVYDGTGDVVLNQAKLLENQDGADTEAKIWSWMKAHPRAAMSLRKHAVRNGVDKKTGFSHPTATANLSDTITQVNTVKNHVNYARNIALSELADHPGFYAMVSLSTKISGMKRYQLRDKTIKTVDKMLDTILYLAKTPGVSVDALVRQAFTDAGYDMDKITEVLAEGNRQETDISVAPSEDVRDTREYHLGQLYEKLSADLSKYVELVGSLPDIKDRSAGRLNAKNHGLSELLQLKDEGALRSYFDTIQVMSSAKTQVSTSINGGESRRNAVLMILAGYTSPDCGNEEGRIVLDVTTFEQEWQKYDGYKAFDPATGRNIPIDEVSYGEIIGLSRDGSVVIENPAACLDPLCP